jgi:hypothetical protein
VCVAIVAGGDVFMAWMCDCEDQPAGVRSDIVRAREWDEQALVYEIELVDDD